MCANNGAKVASYHSDQQKSAITNICQSSNCAWIGLHSATDGNKYWDDGSQYDYKNLLEVHIYELWAFSMALVSSLKFPIDEYLTPFSYRSECNLINVQDHNF